jgi:circadian clock protein KaiC
VASACGRGERCLFFAFEESEPQLRRNMRSIGIDIAPYLAKGLLRVQAVRATTYGIEIHLATMLKAVREFEPQVVVVDPISNMLAAGDAREATLFAARLVDFLKSKGISSLFTSLTNVNGNEAQSEVGISSLADSWLLLRELEANGERNRGLYVLKSRGMPHSHQVREFLLTSRGIRLRDVYVGPEGVLAGSSRLTQEARERARALAARQEIESHSRQLKRRRHSLDAQLQVLRSEFALEEDELRRRIEGARVREGLHARDKAAMARRRGDGSAGLRRADVRPGGGKAPKRASATA